MAQPGIPKQDFSISLMEKPWIPYAAPFILFLAITGLAGFLQASRDIVYIVKTIIVGALLWIWRRHYVQDLSSKLSLTGYLTTLAAGLISLLLWILSEHLLPQLGTPPGFNPYSFGWSSKAVHGLIAIRLAGATLVVPVMEELFWRSFIMRYTINPDFRTVPLGTFSIFSFTITALLLGIEHYRAIQGFLAGIIYAALVIQQKTLKGCILAHATTNLCLGIYCTLKIGFSGRMVEGGTHHINP